MNDKLPFMPLYVFLWQTDEAVRLMDCDARGVYLELMLHQWIHGTIPSAPAELALMLPPHREASLQRALRCFEAERSDPSRCFNPHLRAIRDDIISKRSSAAEAGRKGGIVSGLMRRRDASSDPRSEPQATLKHRASLSPASTVAVSDAGKPKEETETLPPAFTEEWSDMGKPGTAVAVVKTSTLPEQKARRRRLKTDALALAADIIFRYWRDLMGRDPARTILTVDRERKIIRALTENGVNVSEILYALDGASLDDWTMGRAERSTKAYDDLESILMNRGRIEKFLLLVPERGDRHPFLDNGNGA